MSHNQKCELYQIPTAFTTQVSLNSLRRKPQLTVRTQNQKCHAHNPLHFVPLVHSALQTVIEFKPCLPALHTGDKEERTMASQMGISLGLERYKGDSGARLAEFWSTGQMNTSSPTSTQAVAYGALIRSMLWMRYLVKTPSMPTLSSVLHFISYLRINFLGVRWNCKLPKYGLKTIVQWAVSWIGLLV